MEKDVYKKFCIQAYGLIIAILGMILIFTIIVDPLFQYHKPFFNIYIVNERYQNPGILKNFDYDAILTGSSMTENFKVSWFNDIGENIVKVPFAGGYSKDFNNVFKIAFDTHDIKIVYYGIDIFHIFTQNSNETRFELPEYLYDKNFLNDVKYIFNKDIFFNYTISNIEYLIKHIVKDNDLAYNWNNIHSFGKEKVLQNYSKSEEVELPINYYMTQYESNMKNIVEYIERYPNTTFKIFFPPYSILNYDNSKIDAQIAVTKRVMEDLLKYENVELYYFQNIKDIITNLDNYRDYSHYSEDINYYMYICMCKNNEHKITKENYLLEIEKLNNLVRNYDYDKLLNESNRN